MENKEEVLKALAEQWGILPQQPDELTSQDVFLVAQKMGLSVQRIYIQKRLKDLDDAGIVRRRKITSGSGNTFAYRPVEGKSWEDVLQYIKKK